MSARDELLGEWTLHSWTGTDGEGREVKHGGDSPRGELVYLPSGRMAVQIQHDGREPFGDRLAERLRTGPVARPRPVRQRALQRRLGARRRRDRRTGHIVDDLGVDVRNAAEHSQARPLGRAGDPLALPQRDPLPSILRRLDLHKSLVFARMRPT